MGRNRRQGGFSDRGASLEANREKRGGRVLKIFRRVDAEQTQLIGGGLLDLAKSGDIPEVQTSLGYQAYIFDPRLMPRGTNPALMAGFEIGRIAADVEHSDRLIDTGYGSEFGDPQLLGRNRRTILLPLVSERLAQERAAVYSILGKHGVAGFSSAGVQHGHRPKPPTIAVGTFTQPLSKAAEGAVVEAIDTMLAVQLVQYDTQIQLGELEVASYQHNK